MNPEKQFLKFLLSGSFAPKIWNRKSVKQAPHPEQATGHGMHCSKTPFTPLVVQRPGSFWGRFCRTYGCGATGRQSCQICEFSPYKTSKKYIPGYNLQPRSYIAEWLQFFPRGSRRFKKVPSGSEVFLWLLVGELVTPKLAQIFAYGKWLYLYNMLLHGVSDLDQRCLKTCNFKDTRTDVPSHQILRPYPQNQPKTPFWGTC